MPLPFHNAQGQAEAARREACHPAFAPSGRLGSSVVVRNGIDVPVWAVVLSGGAALAFARRGPQRYQSLACRSPSLS